MSWRSLSGQAKRRTADMSSSGQLPPATENSSLTLLKDSSSVHDVGLSDDGALNIIDKKLQRNLLPLFFVLVMVCFVDRANLSFASIQMNEDLDINDEVYGLGAGLFFLGYAMFQVPSNAFLMRMGPSTWLAVITFLWGLCATGFAFCKGVTMFLVLRLVLGLMEAGAMPGMWYSLSMFFPADRCNFPYAVIESGITVSQVVGSPLAAALLQLDGQLGVRGWQWIFIMEGIPTMLLGIVILYALPDSISASKFLDAAEKDELRAAIDAQRHGVDDPLTWSQADQWQLLKSVASDWRVWYAGGWRIFHDVAGYGVLYWTPKLVESMMSPGAADPSAPHTGVKVVLLSAIPFAAASLFHVINAHHSQKVGERRLHIAVPWLVASLSLMLLPLANESSFFLGFLLLTLGHVGVNGANGIQTSWVASCFDGPAKALGLPLYNMIGGFGGFFGPYIIGLVKQRQDSYGLGMVLLGAFLLVGTVMVFLFPDRNGDRNLHKPLPSDEREVE